MKDHVLEETSEEFSHAFNVIYRYGMWSIAHLIISIYLIYTLRVSENLNFATNPFFFFLKLDYTERLNLGNYRL